MSKIYFGKNAEEAIQDYIKCKDEVERHKIYNTKIKPAFAKLTENIINMTRFNFKKIDYYQNLHNEVMAFLYENINKFNPRKISKITKKRVRAFSYFGTIAKNYLIQKSVSKGKTILIEDQRLKNDEDNSSEIKIDELTAPDTEYDLDLSEFFKVLIENFESKYDSYTLEQKKIADAIIYFLVNVQKEIIYNKKHFYLLLREHSGLDSKKITVILNGFKKEYIEIRKNFYDGNM